MRRKVLVIDTSMLCVWLEVPGMETCGSDADRWDKSRIDSLITNEIGNGATLVLPMATIIETGNHIAHVHGDRYDVVHRLCDIMEMAADEQSPWAAFTQQSKLWEKEGLKALAQRWREHGIAGQSIGDASIAEVADFYAKMPNHSVEILTGDAGLKAFEPVATVVPRRRMG